MARIISEVREFSRLVLRISTGATEEAVFSPLLEVFDCENVTGMVIVYRSSVGLRKGAYAAGSGSLALKRVAHAEFDIDSEWSLLDRVIGAGTRKALLDSEQCVSYFRDSAAARLVNELGGSKGVETIEIRSQSAGIGAGFRIIVGYKKEPKTDHSNHLVKPLMRQCSAALQALMDRGSLTSAFIALKSIFRSQAEPMLLIGRDMTLLCSNSAGLLECARWRLGDGQAAAVKPDFDVHFPKELEEVCSMAFEQLRNQAQKRFESHDVTCLYDHRLSARITPLYLHNLPIRTYPPLLITFNRVVKVGKVPISEKDDVQIDPPSELTNKLSQEEKNVYALMQRGLSNQEMASKRGRSIYTIKNQVKSIFRKLGVNSRLELLRSTPR